MAEIWVLNEEPVFSQEYLSFDAVFTTDNIEMRRIEIKIEHIPEIPGSPIKRIRYTQKALNGMVPNIYIAYDSSTGGWDNIAYRTLVFETAPTGDLLTWLQTNGTKQAGPSKKLTKLKYKASDVCQLFDKDKFFATRTIGGVTFTNNGDGSLTINCVSTDGADNPLFLPPTGYSSTFDLYSIEGHKYLLIPLPQSFSYSTLAFIFGSVVSSNGVPYAEIYTPYYSFYTATKTGTYPCYAIYRVKKGATINNVTFKPQLFDLTEMYGAGNEPTTLAEFRQKYPNDLYPYSLLWYSINKTRYITPTKNLFNIGLSTDWQPPVNSSYGYVPIFIGIGKTCTISWDLDYYRKYPGTQGVYMCINTGEQPSTSNRNWLYHQTIPSLQNSQLTVSANSTGYIYFELANGYNANKEYLQKYLFNENLKWQLELGNQKTDYVPHGYLPLNKGVKL